VLLLSAAFVTKETSMYIWPFFGLLMFVECLQQTKSARKFFAGILLSGLLCFTCYFVIYYFYTGDAFYRFNSIMANHYTHPESYFDKPFSHLLVRLTYAPWQMFTESGLLVALLPGLIMAVNIVYHKKFNLADKENFWSWFAIVFFLCFYFGTTSLRYYNPLNLLPRMYFPLLPPFAILAGLFWVKAVHSPKAGAALSILFAITAIYCLIAQSKYMPVYAGYALVALCTLVLRKTYSKTVIAWFFVIVSLIIPVYRMVRPQQWGYQAEKSIFKEYLSSSDGTYLVVTDNRLALTYSWFYQFQYPPNYTFTTFEAVHQLPDTAYTRIFVLLNPHTLRETFGSSADWDIWEQKHKHRLNKLTMSDGVTLYEWQTLTE
jgi:hypothetical protein